jgi:hypothetical protein
MAILHPLRRDVVGCGAPVFRAGTQFAPRRHIFLRQFHEAIGLLTPGLEKSYRSRVIRAFGGLGEFAANDVHFTDIAPHQKRDIG